MSQQPIFMASGEDPAMNRAFQLAKQTFRFYWRELSWERRRMIPGLEMDLVKLGFQDPPESRRTGPNALEFEHMWISDVNFDGKTVSGTLMNQPREITSVKEGDQIQMPSRHISDWMYVIDDYVYGGFTIDVLRQQMPPNERQQHDNSWGLTFGQPGIVKVVPDQFLGLDSNGLSGEQPQDYNLAAETEHPMSVNMRESLEGQLSQDPSFLTQVDERGYDLLQSLALAGSFDGVDVCLKHGADRKAVAANGASAMGLAKAFGWKRIIARLQQP